MALFRVGLCASTTGLQNGWSDSRHDPGQLHTCKKSVKNYYVSNYVTTWDFSLLRSPLFSSRLVYFTDFENFQSTKPTPKTCKRTETLTIESSSPLSTEKPRKSAKKRQNRNVRGCHRLFLLPCSFSLPRRPTATSALHSTWKSAKVACKREDALV
jgi:hypothetical protein